MSAGKEVRLSNAFALSLNPWEMGHDDTDWLLSNCVISRSRGQMKD